MRDLVGRWLFRMGMFVGAAHFFLCLLYPGYSESIETLTKLPWLIAAPILVYCGLLWGAALAVAITGSRSRSVRRWEASLIEFVWYMRRESLTWPLRVVAFTVVVALGWMHLFLLTE